MLLVSVAHLWTFSYRPFTEASQRASLMQVAEALVAVVGEENDDDNDLCGAEGGGGSGKVSQETKSQQTYLTSRAISLVIRHDTM